MKKSFFFIAFIICGTSVDAQQNSLLPLKVSEDRHFLQYENGKPFFWLGDTGWNLWNSLTEKEVETYFDNRKQKSFNVIQCVVVAERKNRHGDLPFTSFNPLVPNEKYFKVIDWSIKQAAQRDLYIAFLPTWGHSVAPLWDESNKAIFNISNAYAYGYFLGKRYKNTYNLVWVLGGDRPAFSDTADWRPIYRNMLKGMRDVGSKALATYHPAGESSSTDFWQKENTLDFNMLQSGHRKQDLPTWEWINRDYNLSPAKPIIDAEPNYEDHPVFWKPELGYFTDYDVRKQLYRSVFAGAAGVTYGHQSVWQFYYQGMNKIGSAKMYLHQALDRPGAFNAGLMKKFIDFVKAYQKYPVNNIVVNNGKEEDHAVAFLTTDSSRAIVYLPIGKELQLNTDFVKAANMYVWWMNPKNGEITKTGNFINNKNMKFTPPSLGYGNDWVLVLDDADKHYAIPESLK